MKLLPFAELTGSWETENEKKYELRSKTDVNLGTQAFSKNETEDTGKDVSEATYVFLKVSVFEQGTCVKLCYPSMTLCNMSNICCSVFFPFFPIFLSVFEVEYFFFSYSRKHRRVKKLKQSIKKQCFSKIPCLPQMQILDA